jgi:VWFA-related protein
MPSNVSGREALMSARGYSLRQLARRLSPVPALAAALAVSVATLAGQETGPAELTTRETQPSFTLHAQRNLVLVRAVVRDGKGQVVGNLHKEDFRLLDNGKLQTISQFAAEFANAKPEAPKPAMPLEETNKTQPGTQPTSTTAERFVALYFDDVHTKFEDLVRARDAAQHYLASSLQPGDRAGVFTSSGQVAQNFTDNRDKLNEALARLRPRPVMPQEMDPCPDISPYQAHLMVNLNDPSAIEFATQSVIECQCGGDAGHCPNPQATAMAAAMRLLNQDETQSRYSLRELEALIRRLALSPGQRSIVMISPGFFAENLHYALDQIIDRALRSGVVINALDAQGLVAIVPGGDAAHRATLIPGRSDLLSLKSQYQTTELMVNSDVMAELAADTGGTFFHNSNDYDGGFRKVAAAAGVYYVLAFSPENLKYDGKFHKLKVELASARGLSVQARRGYYAPKKSLNAEAQANEEVEQAAFSRDELQELPVQIHTQFFKVDNANVELSVLAHLDLHSLHFRKNEQRNLDDLRFITVLFDRDGNRVDGQEKDVQLKLLDTSLERFLQSGMTIKTTFKVKPGTYTIREVVRDAEGGQLSALSRAVEIPF